MAITRSFSLLLVLWVSITLLRAQNTTDSLQQLISKSDGITKAELQLQLADYLINSELSFNTASIDSIIAWSIENKQPEVRMKAQFIKLKILYNADSLATIQPVIEQLEATATRNKDKKMVAQTLLYKGNIEWKKQQYTKAIAIYNQLNTICEKNGYTDLKIELLNQTGLVFRDQGQNEQSLKQFLKALEIESQNPNKSLKANTLNNLGSYYWRSGQLSKALEYYNQALKIRRENGSVTDIALSLINLALVYTDMSEFAKATMAQNEALELIKPTKNKALQSLILTHTGNTFWRSGKYDEALGFYQHAKQIRMELNDSVNLANLDDNIGHVYKMTSRFDSAFNAYNQALQIRQKLNLESKISYSLTNLGSVCMKMARYTDALDYYFKALTIREALGENDETAASLNNIGLVYRDIAEFSKAIDYQQKALEIYEKNNNKIQTAVTLNNLANVYSASGNLLKALDFHMQALRIRQEIGDQQSIGLSLVNIGLIYRDLSEFEKSDSFFNEALQTFIKIGNRQQEAYVLNHLGDLYQRWNKSSKALENYRKSNDLFAQTGDTRGIAVTSENIGQHYLDLGQFNLAAPWLDKAWKIANQIKDGEMMKNTGFDNYQLYEKMGQPSKAFEFYKLYIDSKDSIMNSGNARKLLEIQSRYQLDVKQKEIELLKSRTEFIESNIQYQRRLTLIMTILTILLLATTLQFYFSYRNKKSANRMFEKIFSIIAHDLRSPVSAMNNLAGLLNKNELVLNEQERRNLMGHIEGLTQSLMGLLENLLNWSRSRNGIIEYKPENLSLTELVDETMQLTNPVAMNKHITIETFLDNNLNVYADRNGCLLVLRNLLTNAIKFSRNGGTIRLSAKVEDKMVIVATHDFGIGIAPDKLQQLVNGLNTHSRKGTMNEKGTGMGLKLCFDFVKANKGKLWAESIENEQTIFYFSLPLAKQ